MSIGESLPGSATASEFPGLTDVCVKFCRRNYAYNDKWQTNDDVQGADASVNQFRVGAEHSLEISHAAKDIAVGIVRIATPSSTQATQGSVVHRLRYFHG